MAQAVLRRLGIFALSLLGASIVIFLVTWWLPGDVARVLLGEGAAEADVEALRVQLGLNRPMHEQYGGWLVGMLRGDFGTSLMSQTPVTTLIAPRLAVTFWLVTGALLVAVLIAVPVGMVAALKRRQWQGFVASASAQLGMAVPAFLAGIIAVAIFTVQLRWLPANGYVPLRSNPLGWASHLVLPVLSLGVVQAAVLLRYVRSSFIEVLREDYYRTARSIGWRRGPALLRHGVRNAALPLVTVLGLQLASALVGAIVVEQVFVLPGLGTLLLNAVNQHDLPVIQGVVMLLVVAVLLINALVDIAYVFIDPRLRMAGER